MIVQSGTTTVSIIMEPGTRLIGPLAGGGGGGGGGGGNDLIELESGTGHIELENGTGGIQLET